jgi:transporter family protein
MSSLICALLSALFASLTAILARIGVSDVDSNLATAIRTIIILLFARGIVMFQRTSTQIPQISEYSLVVLTLSGIATGIACGLDPFL